MPKQKTETMRRSASYARWKEMAEFFDANPEVPEILRYLYKNFGVLAIGPPSGNALEQLIRDRYTGFAMIERLKE